MPAAAATLPGNSPDPVDGTVWRLSSAPDRPGARLRQSAGGCRINGSFEPCKRVAERVISRLQPATLRPDHAPSPSREVARDDHEPLALREAVEPGCQDEILRHGEG